MKSQTCQDCIERFRQKAHLCTDLEAESIWLVLGTERRPTWLVNGEERGWFLICNKEGPDHVGSYGRKFEFCPLISRKLLKDFK